MSDAALTEQGGRGAVARYSPGMQALHWLVAALMFALLALAWAMVGLPRGSPDRELLYTLHKSIGVTILLLVTIRLLLRIAGPVPGAPIGTPRWMALCAMASHWLLYAILFAMPVSGYLLSSAGGNAVSYFGLFALPAIPPDPVLQALARRAHHMAQWAAYGLILLHLLATVWHVAIRRDGLLDRELPPQIY